MYRRLHTHTHEGSLSKPTTLVGRLPATACSERDELHEFRVEDHLQQAIWVGRACWRWLLFHLLELLRGRCLVAGATVRRHAMKASPSKTTPTPASATAPASATTASTTSASALCFSLAVDVWVLGNES